jgi:hypothetical protein
MEPQPFAVGRWLANCEFIVCLIFNSAGNVLQRSSLSPDHHPPIPSSIPSFCTRDALGVFADQQVLCPGAQAETDAKQ